MVEAEGQEDREEQEMVDELAEVTNSAMVETFHLERYQSPLSRCHLGQDSARVVCSRFLCRIAAAF